MLICGQKKGADHASDDQTHVHQGNRRFTQRIPCHALSHTEAGPEVSGTVAPVSRLRAVARRPDPSLYLGPDAQHGRGLRLVPPRRSQMRDRASHNVPLPMRCPKWIKLTGTATIYKINLYFSAS